jgi:class 3 adenylate cyclase
MAADREERKLVTVLFADVAGSTSLGERSDPEYLRAILQRFFTEMSDVIVTWGGTVEKYAGDAVLAVFGIPTAREDDPVRAVRAALGMQDRLASLNRELRTLHESGLQVRIGVNTGEVIAPTNPAPDHQLLMTGDAVNVAARLEQAAEPGTILVGDRTWQLTRDQFTFDGPTALNLRGKSEPIEARRVVAALAPDEVRTRPVQAPLIGRDNELRTLRALFDTTVEARAPSLAILYGPAGIGKSRLTREFLEAAAATGTSPQVLRGRCLSAGEGITFWALGEVMRACAGIGLHSVPRRDGIGAWAAGSAGGGSPACDLRAGCHGRTGAGGEPARRHLTRGRG